MANLNLALIYKKYRRMDSKIEHVILNGHNYAIWVPYMETLLKIKGLWQYFKDIIPNPKDDKAKFVIDGKMDEVIGFIKTYISREIHFHISVIDCPHVVWNKIKLLFNKVGKSQVIHIEKELNFLDLHFFEMIDNYLACIKDQLQLKLG